MAKTYINPKTYETSNIETSEVDYFYGWVPVDSYVSALEADKAKLRTALTNAEFALRTLGEELQDVDLGPSAVIVLRDAEDAARVLKETE